MTNNEADISDLGRWLNSTVVARLLMIGSTRLAIGSLTHPVKFSTLEIKRDLLLGINHMATIARYCRTETLVLTSFFHVLFPILNENESRRNPLQTREAQDHAPTVGSRLLQLRFHLWWDERQLHINFMDSTQKFNRICNIWGCISAIASKFDLYLQHPRIKKKKENYKTGSKRENNRHPLHLLSLHKYQSILTSLSDQEKDPKSSFRPSKLWHARRKHHKSFTEKIIASALTLIYSISRSSNAEINVNQNQISYCEILPASTSTKLTSCSNSPHFSSLRHSFLSNSIAAPSKSCTGSIPRLRTPSNSTSTALLTFDWPSTPAIPLATLLTSS
ncbi:plant invertase/pectin methylesterase inhibitor [Striga asiatica]|uniref:Plant invertase/pectin methylesterase inhibitor n=1 Tax=Striga asiatica TaxID=4170 RepID=A0A5A7P7Y7_STRAF|nr:plant invertase/pectin methylesterase inhibitor [Striga asiatica]